MDPLELIESLRASPGLVLLLDYDGTLVPIAERPQDGAPDAALLALLARLGVRPGTQVHVVSDRSREFMHAWFGDMPVHLHAEHCAWSRQPGGEWSLRGGIDTRWHSAVRPVLEAAAAMMPGAFLGAQSANLALHYGGVERASRAAGLAVANTCLAEMLPRIAAVRVDRDDVLEVKPRGLHKGLAAADALRVGASPLAVAVGDDHTDEDMFAALPPGGVSVRVGAGYSAATYRLPDVPAVRHYLEALSRRQGSA